MGNIVKMQLSDIRKLFINNWKSPWQVNHAMQTSIQVTQ